MLAVFVEQMDLISGMDLTFPCPFGQHLCARCLHSWVQGDNLELFLGNLRSSSLWHFGGRKLFLTGTQCNQVVTPQILVEWHQGTGNTI